MRHKRLERLAIFAEAAELLNFAKAAEKLGVSKGHLSQQIKKLEQEYGVPLMVRNTRNIRLTTEGRNALAHFRQINQLLTRFEKGLAELDGTIRITAPALFAETYLTKILLVFSKLHPEVAFDLNTSYQRLNLTESHFDMAFRATTKPPPADMVAKKMFDYHHCVVASPDYLSRSSSLSIPRDLEQHVCLTAQQNTKWTFSDCEIPLNESIACNNNHILKQLAVEAHGVARLPSFFVKDEIESGALVSVLDEFCNETTSLYLLYPTTTRETNRLRQFTAFVTKYFDNSLIWNDT